MSYNAWLYGYANPIRYIDPSGHMCSDPENPERMCESGSNLVKAKEEDPVALWRYCYKNYCSSGQEMYQLFWIYRAETDSWWYKQFGKDKGGFTVVDFFTLVMYFEMAGQAVYYPEDQGLYSYVTSEKTSYFCAQQSHRGSCSGASNNAIMNYLATRGSAGMMYQSYGPNGRYFPDKYKSTQSTGDFQKARVAVAIAVTQDIIKNISSKGTVPLPDWGNSCDGTLIWENIVGDRRRKIVDPYAFPK